MSKTVLVTGGAGFIGSHTAEALVQAGHRVRILDNLSTGHVQNLNGIAGRFDWIEGDIRSDQDVREAVKGTDAVIHLGAVASVGLSVQDPLGTHETNYTGTLRILEACREFGVKKVIYAGSAAVYTPENDQPHTESDAPDPRSPYGMDKLAGEFALKAYRHVYGIQTTTLRFFNIYGPRQDPTSPYSGVISIFMSKLSSGDPITVFGDGLQSRDFVFVSDLASVLATLVDREDAPVLANVGTGRSCTLLELISALEGALGVTARTAFAPPRSADVRFSRADVSILKSLGLKPVTELEDGLRAYVGWLRASHS
jgi:UDP-glucose 4-epimerase